MNRGDEPGAAGPGPEPPSHFAVVIFGDGSASIDGEPVAVVPGEPLDVAILDMLHGYARARNAPVTGAITDPSADYVAIVEVAPDGSSKLLEQVGDGKDGEQAGAAGATPPVAPVPPVAADEPFESGRPRPDAGGPDADGDTRAMPKQPALTTPPPPKPALSKPALSTPSPPKSALPKPPGIRPAVLIGDSGRKKSQSQSDDEYEQPGLFQRPAFIGGVAAAVAALVIGSLVALGSGGSAGAEGASQAAGSGNQASESPLALKPPSPSAPAWKPPSVTTSPSTTVSPSPSGSPSPKASATTKKPVPPKPKTEVNPPPPKPKPKPKPKGAKPVSGPKMPTGDLLIKNKKFGSCLDVPGHGKGRQEARVQDWLACDPSKTDNQRWILHRTHKGVGTGGSDLYVIRNAKDRMCLDIYGESAGRVSAPVTQYGCKPTLADNQLWWFDKRPNGTYWIRNQKSGDMCLDLSRTDKKSANGGVTLYPCNDDDDHQWRFIKA
ncbi:RICIN domain-containing protein [Streptomyces sp. NPDC006645]|uniref:RICIN domain-containing protein n=1 Tax=unclassified Streptomyces TaxID=2593676 RepID=UPI0033A74E33